LGKLEEGIIDIHKESFDIKDFLKEVKEEVDAILKTGQQLNFDYKTNELTINTDSRILRNIFFNLISNASKYSETGKPINVKCNFEKGQFVFSISDEGIGIPKEDQKHMFESFFRASNAGNVQGTGLGLNIVKRYIELLGGSIAFKSEFGKGSTFIITIPR
jgi:signal transduction histidine kinase